MLGFGNRGQKRASKRRKTARVYAGQLPSHLNSIMGEANMLFATGEFEKALRLCEAVIEESPLSISAMQTMGLCCEQLGKGGDAADWLQKAATASHSTDADTWIKVGLLFKSSGQYERALKALKRSVSLAPQDAHLLLEVADCYRALGQPDMEARTLERSLRLCFSKIDGRSGSSSAELSVIGESDEPAPASADSEISASVATCSFDLDAKKSEDAVDSSSSTDDLSPSHLRKLVEIVTNRLCTVYPGCKKRMGLISRVASRLKSLDGRGLPASLILRYGAACGVLGRTDTAEACFELVPLLKSTVDSGDANELGVEVLAAVDMAMAVMKDRAARKAKTFPKGNKVGLRTDSTLAPSLFNDTSTPAVVIRRRTERSGALTVSATMDATRAFERGDFVTTLECVRRCAYVNVTSPVVWDLLSYLIHLLKGGAADPGLARYLVRILLKRPSDASFVLLKAHNALASGSLRHAVGLYHHALRLRPDLPLVHLCLAATYLMAVFQKWTGGQRHRPVLLTFAVLGNYRNARLGLSTNALPTTGEEDDVDVEGEGSGEEDVDDGVEEDGDDEEVDDEEVEVDEEEDGDNAAELGGDDVAVTTEDGQIVVSGDGDDGAAPEESPFTGIDPAYTRTHATLVDQDIPIPVLEQEIEYNTGRAYHQLGLTAMAISCYQKVLEIGNGLSAVNVRWDLRREAAWNMACILRASGNVALAQQLCATYLQLD